MKRSTSPPIPLKPDHLKVKDENPFEDGSETKSIASSSSSLRMTEEELRFASLAVNEASRMSPFLISSTENIHKNPFDDENEGYVNPFAEVEEKKRPELPPRPVTKTKSQNVLSPASTSPQRLGPITVGRREYSHSISSSSILQPESPHRRGPSFGSQLIDSPFQPPPPISNANRIGNRKISTFDSSSLKLKEDIIIPDTTKSFKSLPIPQNLSNLEVFHKGPTRDQVISGFYAVTGSHSIRIYYLPTGENRFTVPLEDKNRCHSVAFVSTPPFEEKCSSDPYVWAGLEKGELVEIDVRTGEIVGRCSSHTAIVSAILRGPRAMYTVDENGGVRIWLPDEHGRITFNQRPHALRIQAKPGVVILAKDLLWTCQGKIIEVYCLREDAANILERKIDSSLGFNIPSNITCLAYNPKKDEVYAGHENGKVSVFDTITLERKYVVQTTSYKILSMVCVVDRLWIGLQTGKIMIFEISPSIPLPNWSCIMEYLCYTNSGVVGMYVDDKSLLAGATNMPVMSMSDSGHIRLWDGLLRDYLLDCSIRARCDEYSTYTLLRAAILTFNIDSRKPIDLEYHDSTFFEDFIQSHDSDIFVFGFQELVDLENKSVNAKSFVLGTNKTVKGKVDNQNERLLLWQEKITSLFPATYSIVMISQLVGLFQCIISKNSFAIKDIVFSQVKTGMGGLYGNKGAIATRFTIGDSSLCFVNCHLAAHQSHVSERNKDVSQILKEANFPKLVRKNHWEGGGDGSMIMDHEHVFFSGDLNYRIDLSRTEVLESVKQENWQLLWNHDQLLKQKADNPAFGLRPFTEAPLQFAPTFKYNRGTDQYDSSEKMRIPAYCDRILYRGRIRQMTYSRQECLMSDHRPVSGSFDIPIRKIDHLRFLQIEAEAEQKLQNTLKDVVQGERLDYMCTYFQIPRQQAEELLRSKNFHDYFQR